MRIKIALFTFLVLIGCRHKDEKTVTETNSDYYDQLILNLAMNIPDYRLGKDYFFNYDEFDSIKLNILQKSKVVYDDSLGLRFILHTWANYGGDFPKVIVSVANDSVLLHAFPFYDEYYYHLHRDRITDEKLRYALSDQFTFGDHVNFALRQAGSNVTKHDKSVNRFITLLADSLLGLHEYKMDDSLKFKKEIEEVFFKAKRNNTKQCESSLEANINKILSNARKQNLRLFSAREGEFGFWQFQVTRRANQLRVITTFENEECYFAILM